MRNQPLVLWTILFALGAAALGTTMTVGMGLLGIALPIAVAAVAAGLIEAAQTRRTGRRRYVASWGPLVLGVIVPMAVMIAFEEKGPDSGLALSVTIAGMLVIIPLVAVLVNLVAFVALRIAPAPAAGLPPSGPPQ